MRKIYSTVALAMAIMGSVTAFAQSGKGDVAPVYQHIEKTMLYPNPCAGVLNIRFDDNHTYTYVKIYNAIGQTVVSMPVDKKQVSIDLNKEQNGLYIIYAQSTEKYTDVAKFVMKK